MFQTHPASFGPRGFRSALGCLVGRLGVLGEQPPTSAVVLSNIAGVLTMAMWIIVVEKIRA
jgi:hypothetical protein